MIERIVVDDWLNDSAYSDFLLNKSDNGTIFHLPEFLSYHPESFFKEKKKLQIKFYKKNQLIASIIGLTYTENGLKYFQSPYGASYGGLVVDQDINFEEYEAVVNSFLDYLKETSVNAIKITNTTSVHSKNLKSTYGDFIFLSKGFQIIKSDLLLFHQLNPEEELTQGFDRKSKSELNQSLSNANLSCKLIEGVDEESYALLLGSQERLQSKPTHTLKELYEIENLIPDTIKTFKIMNEGKQISGIITFAVNRFVLNTFYIFDDQNESRNLKANHYAYYNVLKWAEQRGYKYIDFGPSTFGFEPNYTLIRFKEKFDSKPTIRNTYYKTLAS